MFLIVTNKMDLTSDYFMWYIIKKMAKLGKCLRLEQSSYKDIDT